MPHHGNLCAVEHDDVDTVAALEEKQMDDMVSYFQAECNEWTQNYSVVTLLQHPYNKKTNKQQHLLNKQMKIQFFLSFSLLLRILHCKSAQPFCTSVRKRQN